MPSDSDPTIPRKSIPDALNGVDSLNTSPCVDRASLDKIIALQHEAAPDLLERVILTFLKNTPLLVATMTEAVGRNDQTALRHAAHSLKSGSANLGAQQLSFLCKLVEDACRTLDSTIDIKKILSEVQLEFERVRCELVEILHAHRGW